MATLGVHVVGATTDGRYVDDEFDLSGWKETTTFGLLFLVGLTAFAAPPVVALLALAGWIR